MSDIPVRTEPQISVCMIVRDEERVLQRCFDSLRGLDFELIVVDTGSVDDTIAIAEHNGAQVHRYLDANGEDGLIEDFAAARDEALRHATGRWVLQIDADEVLHEGHDIIHGLDPAQRSEAIAVALQSGNTNWHNIRIFQRGAARGYSSPIHEFIRFQGKMEIESGIRIENLPDKTGKESGYDRNVRLLRKALRKEPDRGRLWHYLGNEYRLAGDYRAGVQAYAKAQQLDNYPGALLLSIYYRGICHFLSKDYENAEAVARQAVECAPDRAEGYCLLADALFCLDRFEEAREFYEMAAARPFDQEKSMMPVRTWAFSGRPEEQIAIIDAILG